MSSKFVQDIEEMHEKYEVYEAIQDFSLEKRRELLNFRMGMLREEFNETMTAHREKDAEEVVDGLIDLIVIAIGTLDLFDVSTVEAWDEVLRANMSKKVGVKPERPNPLGLPDLIKPEGWEAPYHLDNMGWIERVYYED